MEHLKRKVEKFILSVVEGSSEFILSYHEKLLSPEVSGEELFLFNRLLLKHLQRKGGSIQKDKKLYLMKVQESPEYIQTLEKAETKKSPRNEEPFSLKSLPYIYLDGETKSPG